MPVFGGVQSVFRRHQLDLVALLCGTDEDPGAYLNRVVGRRFVDGLIISATIRDDPRIPFLLERKIPFVALGRSAAGGCFPWIDLDFEGVAVTAVTRLAASVTSGSLSVFPTATSTSGMYSWRVTKARSGKAVSNSIRIWFWLQLAMKRVDTRSPAPCLSRSKCRRPSFWSMKIWPSGFIAVLRGGYSPGPGCRRHRFSRKHAEPFFITDADVFSHFAARSRHQAGGNLAVDHARIRKQLSAVPDRNNLADAIGAGESDRLPP